MRTCSRVLSVTTGNSHCDDIPLSGAPTLRGTLDVGDVAWRASACFQTLSVAFPEVAVQEGGFS